MGTLIAMHYPTKLFFGAADHTYVKCGTGVRAWACWGGKTGGNPLRSGSGSTNQANAIAEPNEHAGITCYLINGVCHQAANRILFAAGIFVTGAKGYGLSVAIYGPYGRPRGLFGTCKAPFNRHPGMSGDLPECVAPALRAPTAPAGQSTEEQRYFGRVSAAYDQVGPEGLQSRIGGGGDLVDFMVNLFDHKIEYNLGARVDEGRRGKLRDLRASSERSRIAIESEFEKKNIAGRNFVEQSERETISFQRAAAEVLYADEYTALFDVPYAQSIVLADPDIVAIAYPN